MSGPRHLVVHLPAFRLERCGYDASDLAGLIAEEKSAMRIQALTPAARAQGLAPSMTASEARALVPEVELLPLDPDGERQDRVALARALGALSDRVAFPHPEDVVIEVSGSAHLWGGDAGIGRQALELVGAFGHRARVAVADDPLAARALATWAVEDGEVGVAEPGQAASLLAPLPLAALCPPLALAEALRAVGIERVGAWARLDPAAVAGRFGESGVVLHQVAQGRVATADTLDWGALDDDRPAVRTSLGGATSSLQLHFVLPGLLAELSHKLGARDLAVLRLRVVLRLEPHEGRSSVASLGIRVGRPTRSARTLERLVRVRLEDVRIEAPVDELVLEAAEVTAERAWQPGLTDRTEATEPLPDLLARLVDHLGEGTVFAPRLADAWRPEIAWMPEPFPPPLRARSPPRAALALHSDDPVEVLEAFEHTGVLPRPSLLLPEPRRIEVGCHDERPVRVHLEQGWVAVDRAAGPERLMGEWWSGSAFQRDYWVLSLRDRTAWVFWEHARWWLHGWF